ncbi:MAG: poly-beta-1,6 N-acetyl-D-glucosamine synthase, partial [Pseudomonadota bacterium]
TLKGLWKQRVRWAQGGAEVLFKFIDIFSDVKKRRMWPIYTELVVSIFWAYLMCVIFILWAVGKFVDLPTYLQVTSIVPGWNGT